MITSIRLQNFRSYDDASFEFTDGVNIIVGPNASGKTNILEGLSFLCSGKSFRSNIESSVQNGKPWARIDGVDEQNRQRTIKLEKQNDGIQKKITIDSNDSVRMPAKEALPTVLFEPNHLLLLTTSPENRREFIDTIISQIDPAFAKDKRDYKRTMAQRNRLLKLAPQDIKEQIFVWNIRMSEVGARIARRRQQLVKEMKKGLSQNYKEIAQKDHALRLAYSSKLSDKDYASAMVKTLEANLANDIARAATSVGPHRDDLIITIDGESLQTTASRGEVRTALLALKMQETKLIMASIEKRPILLLDDVFSELDGVRRKALTLFIKDFQSFVTTTDADVIHKDFVRHNNLISTSK